MTAPDWLKTGQWVKVLDWCGVIVDVAISETRIMLLVDSPKCAANSPHPEWLEYREGMIEPATPFQVNRDFERYTEVATRRLHKVQELKNKWPYAN